MCQRAEGAFSLTVFLMLPDISEWRNHRDVRQNTARSYDAAYPVLRGNYFSGVISAPQSAQINVNSNKGK